MQKPYDGHDLRSVIELVKDGERPSLDAVWKAHPGEDPSGGAQSPEMAALAALVVACWDSLPDERPSAAEVAAAVADIRGDDS